jgi:Tol biopolymer transport system component
MIITDRTEPDKDLYSLHSLSIDSRERRRLTSPPDASLGDMDPAVSPDGTSVAFVRRYATDFNELYLLRLTGDLTANGVPIRLLPKAETYRSPAWTTDGQELVFQAGWFHLPFLARLRPGEDAHSRIGLAGEFAQVPSISRAGHRMSFRRGRADISIWELNLGGPGGPHRKAWSGSSTYLDHIPRHSPDGRRVAFVSNRHGSETLWMSDKDGSRAQRLTSFPNAQVTGCSWTQDGSEVVIQVVTGTGTKAYTVSSDGGSPRELDFPGYTINAPSQANDGKSWFFSSKKTGEWQIWKASSDNRLLVQVTKKGGRNPRESSDGKYLYYTRSESDPGLWRVPVNGGTEEKVLESLATPMSFQVMDEGIYYIPQADPDGRSSIRLHRFATGKSETLATLDKPVMWGFSVSPDRRTILYVQIDSSSHDLMLMDNFR